MCVDDLDHGHRADQEERDLSGRNERFVQLRVDGPAVAERQRIDRPHETGADQCRARLADPERFLERNCPVGQHEQDDQRRGQAHAGIPYQLPTLGMLAQGSCTGSDGPFCSSSIEIPSGVRMKAIRPSRGGRLTVTPASITR